MSDERELHDDNMPQDWAGGPPVDPRGAEVEAHYQDWQRRQDAAGMPPELSAVQDHIRQWLTDQLGLPLDRDMNNAEYEALKIMDQDQDRRATGPSMEQERQARALEEEEGRFTAF